MWNHVPLGLVTHLHPFLGRVTRHRRVDAPRRHHDRGQLRDTDERYTGGKDGNARATLGKSNAPVVPSISPGICLLDHPYFARSDPPFLWHGPYHPTYPPSHGGSMKCPTVLQLPFTERPRVYPGSILKVSLS
ncbi:hypothetical protein KM043_007099 [Ampulex compressa]|nr:hypothetical protein KM043_007099 [Ampulex compressa]